MSKLYRKKRPVEKRCETFPYRLVAAINDDQLKMTDDYQSVIADDRVTLIRTLCQEVVPWLMMELVADFNSLPDDKRLCAGQLRQGQRPAASWPGLAPDRIDSGVPRRRRWHDQPQGSCTQLRGRRLRQLSHPADAWSQTVGLRLRRPEPPPLKKKLNRQKHETAFLQKLKSLLSSQDSTSDDVVAAVQLEQLKLVTDSHSDTAVTCGGEGTAINLHHDLVDHIFQNHHRDPALLYFLASHIYSTVNLWLLPTTDDHEHEFHAGLAAGMAAQK
jgi:hypothetical protein